MRWYTVCTKCWYDIALSSPNMWFLWRNSRLSRWREYVGQSLRNNTVIWKYWPFFGTILSLSKTLYNVNPKIYINYIGFRINFLCIIYVYNQTNINKLFDDVWLIPSLCLLKTIVWAVNCNKLQTFENRESVVDQCCYWATLSRPLFDVFRQQATFSRHRNSLPISSRQGIVYGDTRLVRHYILIHSTWMKLTKTF